MKPIFKDPFVHFLGLGLLLFIGHGVWENAVAKTQTTIVIDAPVRARLAAVFKAEQNREPNTEELSAVIDGYITEQALSREAARTGLDEGDTIITRRLAQKMRFMLESNALPNDPGDAVLKAWQTENAEKFILPKARAISHVYLSAGNTDRAPQVAAALNTAPENFKNLGDPFMLQSQYGLLDSAAMTRLFGRVFTESVMALPDKIGAWQGPVESAFGLHFVRIDRMRAREVLPFETARADILNDWQNAQLDTQNARRIKDVIAKYKIDRP